MDEEINYVGVLASDEDVQASGSGKYSVFVNQSDVLQFNVKLISRNPGKMPDVRFFVGYSNKFPMIADTRDFIEESRVENYKNELSKYLLGFTYKINFKGFPIIEKIMLKDKVNSFTEGKTYFSVPTYRIGNIIKGENFAYSSLSVLLERLKMNRYLGIIDGFVTDSDTPPFLIWDDGIDKYAVGIFDEHKYSQDGFSLKFKKLKYVQFAEHWYEEIFDFADNKAITYIKTEIYKEIMISLENSEVYYEIKENVEENKNHNNENSCEEILSEEYLIEQFELIARNEGLYYDRKDLINFHTAMKTSQLVILSGMSGTGKSRLVRCYAQALGIADNGYKMIPVRPSWNDDSDLIGFVDSMHMVYRPSDTGFVELLQNASEEINKNSIYLICLDEMNLARVEYYFSQLLSILEMPEKSRILELYDSDMKGKLYNSSKYKREITIGENIKFVGTVNIDESTFHFSDKVLDRANVISLNVVPYITWKPIDASDKSKIKGNPITLDDYQKFVIKRDNKIQLSEREISFLWEIHLLFNKVNKNLGVGPRIVSRIGIYVENVPKALELTRKEAFDLQIVQRVLTKLRGPKEQLKGILDMDSNSEFSSFYSIIEKYKDVSEFKNTIETLEVKKQELEVYGYTL
ncbi:hypothetical protein SDC9_58039 [bioreactor metagenome]|uniref:Uncharacterized protein n=1 Tax=bioreactor metagenome TaxID=1076179 RepID=A0A644X6I8_9ZZZZ